MSRVECYWCDDTFRTEFGRIIHLWRTHPTFFERYDEVNSWIGEEHIPQSPELLEPLDAENDDLSDIPTQKEVEERIRELTEKNMTLLQEEVLRSTKEPSEEHDPEDLLDTGGDSQSNEGDSE